MTKTTPTSGTRMAPALARGLTALEFLRGRADGVSLSEAATALRFPKNSLLRLFTTFEAILAFLPDDARDALLEGHVFTRYTASTITDRKTFASELAATAARGYATDCGEQGEGTKRTALCSASPSAANRWPRSSPTGSSATRGPSFSIPAPSATTIFLFPANPTPRRTGASTLSTCSTMSRGYAKSPTTRFWNRSPCSPRRVRPRPPRRRSPACPRASKS